MKQTKRAWNSMIKQAIAKLPFRGVKVVFSRRVFVSQDGTEGVYIAGRKRRRGRPKHVETKENRPKKKIPKGRQTGMPLA